MKSEKTGRASIHVRASEPDGVVTVNPESGVRFKLAAGEASNVLARELSLARELDERCAAALNS